jgi:signal recognition particle receptor subunit beta
MIKELFKKAKDGVKSMMETKEVKNHLEDMAEAYRTRLKSIPLDSNGITELNPIREKLRDITIRIREVVNSEDYQKEDRSDTLKKLAKIEEELSKKDITITVLASMSVGKSTFLNALIFEDDLLQSDTGETTGKLFKIQYGENSSDELKELIENINHSALDKVKEKEKLSIEEMIHDVEVKHSKLEQGVIIYDTPGFGTVNKKTMEELVDHAIKESDVAIVLLDISKGLDDSNDNEFIERSIKSIPQERMFVVLNKLDSFIDTYDIEDNGIEWAKKERNKKGDEVKAKLKERSVDPKIHQAVDTQTFALSSKTALRGKKKQNDNFLEQSFFKEFEDVFWQRVVEIKLQIVQGSLTDLRTLSNELLEAQKSIEEASIKNSKNIHKIIEDMENSNEILLKLIEKHNPAPYLEKSEDKFKKIERLKDYFKEDFKNFFSSFFDETFANDNLNKILDEGEKSFWQKQKDKFNIKRKLEKASVTVRDEGNEKFLTLLMSYTGTVEKYFNEIRDDVNSEIGDFNKEVLKNIELLQEVEYSFKDIVINRFDPDTKVKIEEKGITIGNVLIIALGSSGAGIVGSAVGGAGVAAGGSAAVAGGSAAAVGTLASTGAMLGVSTAAITIVTGGLAVILIAGGLGFAYRQNSERNKEIEEKKEEIKETYLKGFNALFDSLDFHKAQDEYKSRFRTALNNWKNSIDQLQKAIKDPSQSKEQLQELEAKIERSKLLYKEIKDAWIISA